MPTTNHVIFNPTGPDLQFTGKLALDHISRTGGRIRIFQTEGGAYVIEQLRHASRHSTHLHRVVVADSDAQLKRELGDTHGGKEALEKFGLPHIRTI